MAKYACCEWCLTPIKVPNSFDPIVRQVVCNRGCRDAETLFRIMFSDEQINRNRHYDDLTQGGDCG